MRRLKLKSPVVRAYIHTPLSCWSAYLSVSPSGMELPLNVSKMPLRFLEASFSISYHVLVVIYPAFLCVWRGDYKSQSTMFQKPIYFKILEIPIVLQ